jgi:hypothetical protein
MRNSIYLLSGILCILLGCKKSEPASDSAENALITQARAYFTKATENGQTRVVPYGSGESQNPRLTSERHPDWSKATIFLNGSSKWVVVPIKYSNSILIKTNFSGSPVYDINSLSLLCIFADSSAIPHAYVITYFPDSIYRGKKAFSGIAFVEDWQGNSIAKHYFDPGGRILTWNGNDSSLHESTVRTESETQTNLGLVETCYSINGYNYSVDDPENGYSWSESAGCSYEYESLAPQNESSGPTSTGIGTLGALNGINAAALVVISGGNNVIANITDYFKCFTNVAGSTQTYTVTVCVDEPDPGTREAWRFSGSGSSGTGNPVDAGHTFLILSETYGLTRIVRNVGFYPVGSVNPYSPKDQGELNDDESHPYDIALTIGVTNSQFFSILSSLAVGNSSGYLYNVNTNNCTTFVINAMNSASIALPSTIGNWTGGSGNDPGDLGEDIRIMNLSSNMIRSLVFNNHPNVGTCNY